LKIFFIVLIVLIIAFVAIEVVGVSTNSGGTASGYKDGDPVINCPGSKYQIFCSMNSIMEPFGPKLKLNPTTFSLSKNKATLQVPVPADSKNSFRNAKFVFKQGTNCATVTYTSLDKDTSSSGNKPCSLQSQMWPTCDGKTTSKLVITKSGGILDFRLAANAQSCQISLQ